MWIGNKLFLVFPFLFPMVVLSVNAETSAQGRGWVHMQGSIIDTACAITIESRDQVIDMDVVPLVDIMRDGQGRSRPFSIELVNCVLDRANGKPSDRKQFQITFEGDAEGDLFGVRGEASGIALRITDQVGNIAAPGKPLLLNNIDFGTMQLNYTLKLVANNRALKSGGYFSSIRFKLDYF